MTHNNRLFSCLCEDLELLVDPKWTISDLKEIRKEFLDGLESAGNDSYLLNANVMRIVSKLFVQSVGRTTEMWIRDIHQVLCFQLKIKAVPTAEQASEYLSKFLEREEVTRKWRLPKHDGPKARDAMRLRLARYLVRYVMKDLDLSPAHIAEFARHGPGAVFDRSEYDDKSELTTIYEQLHQYIPRDFFWVSPITAKAMMGDSWKNERSIKCRLALVPKDIGGPRGVFISPKEAVFCQIGIDECVKRYLSTSIVRWSYTPWDQSLNQCAAYEGSATGNWSTLDLSDASDRIPMRLVGYLFNKRDYRALACTRPTFCLLPKGTEHQLAMFSPMGDGKTFVVLTAVCLFLALAAMLEQDDYWHPSQISDELIERYSRYVCVYGDDVAVHGRYFESVVSLLEACNLKVNRMKSFSNGLFRESCGLDAFNGKVITPLRQKVDMDSRKPELEGLIDFHNRAKRFFPHLTRTIEYVREFVVSRFRNVSYTGNPVKDPLSLYDAYPERLNYRLKQRWNNDLQVREVYTHVGVRSLRWPDPLCDRYRYLYSLFPGPKAAIKAAFGTRKPGSGSPRTARFLESRLTGCPIDIIQRPRQGIRLGWKELPAPLR